MTAVDDWMVRTIDGKLVRGVEVSRHDTSTAGVAVDGWQHQDGTVERYIGLYDVKDMSAAQGSAHRSPVAAKTGAKVD